MTKKKDEVIISPATLLGEIGLDNFSGPDDSDMWADQYPYVQWNNNEKMWEFPLKHWAGTQIEQDHKLVEVDHGQETEHGFLLDTIHVSVIAWRYTWETQGDDGKMIYTAQPEFGNGQSWSKRYNFLCLIREVGDDEPAIITAKGYTGEFLYNALNQGRKRTLKMVRTLTGKQFPGYLFWVPLTAGEKRMVGSDKKSAIYPPAPVAYNVADVDMEGIANLIKALYVGDAIKTAIGSYLYDEGQKWAIDVPQRPALSDGKTQAEAEILPGGILYLPDLSEEKPPKWIDCAMTIDGLFEHRQHASNAFAKMLRSQGLTRSTRDQQWEGWRAELESRVADMLADQEELTTKHMLAG